jgi:hypothetical protein
MRTMYRVTYSLLPHLQVGKSEVVKMFRFGGAEKLPLTKAIRLAKAALLEGRVVEISPLPETPETEKSQTEGDK